MPQISVVMPVLNGEKYLAAAIDSILRQTFSDFEFLIIFEKKTNLTSKIIMEEYAKKDSRVVLLENPGRVGISASLNYGISKSTGQYIARMDADDISLPSRFRLQIDFMQKNPDIAICGGNIRYMNAEGKIQFVTAHSPITHERIKAQLLFFCCIQHPTVFFRREMLINNNLCYNEDYGASEDYDLWCRACHFVKIARIPNVILHYRWFSDNATHQADTLGISNYILTMKQSFFNLGLTFSDEEMRLLCPLTSRLNRQNVNESIRILSDCRSRIEAANAELKIYEMGALTQALDERFYWRKHKIRLLCAVMIRSKAQDMEKNGGKVKLIYSLANYLEAYGFVLCGIKVFGTLCGLILSKMKK